jgi:GT2 family glycosyltransferase
LVTHGGTSIGVVILDCDQAPLTARCLESIAGGTRLPHAIVVVANSRNAAPLREACAASGLAPVVLEPGRNLGCAGGRNFGLDFLTRETDCERFVLLDNDAVVTRSFFERVGQVALARLEAAAPVIRNLATNEVWSSGGCSLPDGTIKQLRSAPDTGPVAVDWAPGACLILSRATWASVGHFSRTLDFLFEDIEWCHRLRAGGGAIRVHADLQILHEPQQSLGGGSSSQRAHLMARNGTVYLMAVQHVPLGSSWRWVGWQLRLALRDALTGRVRKGLARLTGLGRGLLEARRWPAGESLSADG